MADAQTLRNWIDLYLRAWETNDPADIAAMFTEDAEYRYHPYDEPVKGVEAISASWRESRDEPGTWSFDWHPVAVQGDTAVLEGRTGYTDGPDYRNLWVVEFAEDGRARSFTEWYMAEKSD